MQSNDSGGDGGAGRPGRPARTLYRDQRITVTDRSLTVEGHSFAVRELENVATVRGSARRLLWSATTAVMTAPIAAFAVAAAAIDGVSGRWWVVVAGSAGVAAAITAAVVRVVRPPTSQLWSQYRGEQVLLLSDRDETRFRQICRALMRAQDRTRAD